MDALLEAFLDSSETLAKVGQGFCGTVWAGASLPDTTALVIKRADGGPGRSLPNEQYIHSRILHAINDNNNKKIEENSNKLNIPSLAGFWGPNAPDFWSKILPRLPSNFSACEALVSERIPAMSLAVRETLAKHYCPNKELFLQMAQDKSNESCLIRPYLGRRRPEQKAGPRQRFFSLRNFPLHVDQMEELNLPCEEYALAMADALAFLHWTAKIDAGDVEFVLAPPRPADVINMPSIGDRVMNSEVLGPHSMWILDFDCCKELEMNESGMRRAAMCFWRNDPFYPRPGSKNLKDQRLWDTFEARFLQKSGCLLAGESDEVKMLPEILIQTIRDNRHTWAKGAIN